MNDEPSTTGDNGRGPGGKFGKGNRFAKGNPHAKRTAAIRSAIFRAVKPKDIETAVKALIEQAKAGDRFALAEVLDRTVGKSITMDVEDRISRLEAAITNRSIER